MQFGPKEAIDGDLAENYNGISDFRTEDNRSAITCAECGMTLYADEATARNIQRSIEQGLDNPFLCGDCVQASQEADFYDR